jgi:hypothetical protein
MIFKKYIFNDSHIDSKDIDIDKIDKTHRGLIMYKDPKSNKNYVLFLRLPICNLDKYSIDYYQLNQNNCIKSHVNLKIPMNLEFTKTSFYTVIQNILIKYSESNNSLCKVNYPVFDSNKKSNYLKIKNMDYYSYYSVIEIINYDEVKIKTKQHKISSISDLYSIFGSGIQVVPYVKVYYHSTTIGNFVTLKPIKFYIGKNITMEQIEYISKRQKHAEIPKSDFFEINQPTKPVLVSDLMAFIENVNNTDNTKENTEPDDIIY